MFCLIFLNQALYGGAVGVEVEVRNLLGQLVILFHLLVESLGIAFQRQCVGSGESVIDLLGQETCAFVTHMDRTQKPHFLTVFTGNVVEQGSCLVFGFGFLGHLLGDLFVSTLGGSFEGLIKLQRQFVVLILNGMDALVVVTGSHGDTGVLVNGQVAVEFGVLIFGSQIVQERGIVPQHFANVVLHGIAKVIVELIFQIVYAAKIVTGDILPEIHIQNTGQDRCRYILSDFFPSDIALCGRQTVIDHGGQLAVDKGFFLIVFLTLAGTVVHHIHTGINLSLGGLFAAAEIDFGRLIAQKTGSLTEQAFHAGRGNVIGLRQHRGRADDHPQRINAFNLCVSVRVGRGCNVLGGVHGLGLDFHPDFGRAVGVGDSIVHFFHHTVAAHGGAATGFHQLAFLGDCPGFRSGGFSEADDGAAGRLLRGNAAVKLGIEQDNRRVAAAEFFCIHRAAVAIGVHQLGIDVALSPDFLVCHGLIFLVGVFFLVRIVDIEFESFLHGDDHILRANAFIGQNLVGLFGEFIFTNGGIGGNDQFQRNIRNLCQRFLGCGIEFLGGGLGGSRFGNGGFGGRGSVFRRILCTAKHGKQHGDTQNQSDGFSDIFHNKSSFSGYF